MFTLLSNLRKYVAEKRERSATFVLVGLDNAGKTTILYRLNLGDVITTTPTVGSNVEEVVHRKVRFQVWDLGGQDKLRKVWSTYFVGAHAIILVVDSTDRERIGLLAWCFGGAAAWQLALSRFEGMRAAVTHA